MCVRVCLHVVSVCALSVCLSVVCVCVCGCMSCHQLHIIQWQHLLPVWLTLGMFFYSNSGRKLTSHGQRDMDRIAGQVECIML